MANVDIKQMQVPGSNDTYKFRDDRIGNTDISSVGDGTVSGAISALANTVVGSFSYDAATGHIYFTPYSGSPYTFILQNGHMMVNT